MDLFSAVSGPRLFLTDSKLFIRSLTVTRGRSSYSSLHPCSLRLTVNILTKFKFKCLKTYKSRDSSQYFGFRSIFHKKHFLPKRSIFFGQKKYNQALNAFHSEMNMLKSRTKPLRSLNLGE